MRRIPLAQQMRHGAPGEAIPGSTYVRAYCAVCGEPIRVPRSQNVHTAECCECHGALPRRLLRQQHGTPQEFRPALRGRQ